MDSCSVFALQFFECGFGVGVRREGNRGAGPGTRSPRRKALDLANGHAALGDAACEAKSGLQIINSKQGARVSGREAPFFEKVLDGRLELQQADGVCNRGAVFAGPLGDLFLSE